MSDPYSRLLKFETPNRKLTATDPKVMRGDLNFARQAVLDDMGPIPIAPYAEFVEKSMPKDLDKVSPKDIEDMKKILIEKNVLEIKTLTDDNGKQYQVEQWSDCKVSPSQSSEDEAKYFERFKPLYTNISDVAKDICSKNRDNTLGAPAITRYEITGNANLLSEANNSSRCDAALLIEDEIYNLADLDNHLRPVLIERSESDDVKTPANAEGVTNTFRDLQIYGDIVEKPIVGPSTRKNLTRQAKTNANEANLNRRDKSRRAQTETRTKKAAASTEKKKDKAKPRESWHRVGVSWELKKVASNKFKKENMLQSVWGGNFMLRNDPCRRFAYSVTVEDKDMRVWKYTRAGVVVTDVINWMEDIDKVIEIFALFALASKTELGWDESVTRVMVDNEIQFVYEVCGKQYVTYGPPLCDYRADVLLGRGTRIYDVYLRGTDPLDIRNHFALKDLWTRDGSGPEGEFLYDLRKKMTKYERRYFLNPKAYELLEVYNPRTKEIAVDSTSSFLSVPPSPYGIYMVDYNPEENKSKIKPVPGSRHPYSHGATPNLDRAKVKILESVTTEGQICHRHHERTLFREVCIPLHEVYNLRVYFRGLIDATTALKTLHRLGYVHRDVSTGNVLWCTLQKVAKLADLEYKKGLGETFVSDDFRTGTYQFMPIDVHGKDIYADGSLREIIGTHVTLTDAENTNTGADLNADASANAGNADGGSAISENMNTDAIANAASADANANADDADDITSAYSVSEKTLWDSESDRDNFSAVPDDYNSDEDDYRARQLELDDDEQVMVPPEVIDNGQQSVYFARTAKVERRLVFRYTILHDFESIFWMGLWGLLYHQPAGYSLKGSIYNRRLISQIKAATTVFPSAPLELPLVRYGILMRDGDLEDVLTTLPAIFQKPASALVEMRNSLVKAYLAYYKTSPENHLFTADDAAGFYQDFRRHIRPIGADKGNNFQLAYLNDSLLKMARRRGLHMDESDEEIANAPPLGSED